MEFVFHKALVLACAFSWMSLSTGFGLASVDQAPSAAHESIRTRAKSATPTDVTIPDTAKIDNRPLPDIEGLMHAVETNQRAAETIEKDYLYRSTWTLKELDGHGAVKKTETEEYDVFWVEGVPVHRLMKKNGKDLSADDQKKENERIDKEILKVKEKRRKADEKGKETGPHGEEEVTVSRLLELGRFTNARRVQWNGRDTIAVDFAGDPNAKTKTRFEEVIRDMVGTAWVDEQDQTLVKAQGHFLNSFKIGGGLVANIQKGTSFSMEQRKVNNEVWLPAMVEGQGEARTLLFFNLHGSVHGVESDYRKFKATSTIVPVESTVPPSPPTK
ncbi:hypothetical protein RBB77_19035 [Tunturibacter psychrotolerans]|uniref:Uncharacterized protein n=1 Tax=Tunturiibacter psychrotolerans TaxID=3069686 RepID=A0AAU7ZNJ4_9BACT